MAGESRLFFQHRSRKSRNKKTSAAPSNTGNNAQRQVSGSRSSFASTSPVDFGSSCPRCTRSFSIPEVRSRSVKETTCGHVLCRLCFLASNNESGCWQCRTESSGAQRQSVI